MLRQICCFVHLQYLMDFFKSCDLLLIEPEDLSLSLQLQTYLQAHLEITLGFKTTYLRALGDSH